MTTKRTTKTASKTTTKTASKPSARKSSKTAASKRRGRNARKATPRKRQTSAEILDRAWEIVCGMEDDVVGAQLCASAITLLTETLDQDDRAAVVQHMAFTISERIRAAEEYRGELFHLLHAHRQLPQVGSARRTEKLA